MRDQLAYSGSFGTGSKAETARPAHPGPTVQVGAGGETLLGMHASYLYDIRRHRGRSLLGCSRLEFRVCQGDVRPYYWIETLPLILLLI